MKPAYYLITRRHSLLFSAARTVSSKSRSVLLALPIIGLSLAGSAQAASDTWGGFERRRLGYGGQLGSGGGAGFR